MEKNVPFDPCVSAVEVEHVVTRADKNVVIILNNWLIKIPIAAREIHNVVIAGGAAEKAFTHNAATAGFNAAHAVQELERRRACGENTIADQERAVVQRHVLVRRRAERGMIEIKRAAGDLDT